MPQRLDRKLLVTARLRLEPLGSAPVEVRRAMPILGREGVVMGTVAAVVVKGASEAATHLLLCRLGPQPEYRLVRLTLIERVGENFVQLRIASADADRLPRRAAT
jgi:hypothetical protein